jgi:amino acid transporter
VLVLLAIFLSTVGQIGLIRGTLKAEAGVERIRFGELFSEGAGYFWRILGLGLLVGLVGGLLFILIGVPFMIVTCGLGLLLIIPLIWLVVTVVQMAYNAIAIENKGVMDGLRRGWEVVKGNIGTMVLMSLILYLGIGFIGGLILAIPLIVVLIPVVIGISAMFIGGQEPQWFAAGGIIFGLLCVLVYLPFVIAFGGLLRAYIGSAWTLTYLRLSNKPQVLEPIPNPIQ